MDSSSISSSELSSSGSEFESDEEETLMVSTGTSRKSMMASFAKLENVENMDFSRKSDKKSNSGSAAAAAANQSPANEFKNKQRVMLLSSRGITHRYRHLMNDLEALLPHAKKDSKFDSKGNLTLLNELADLNSCNNTIFFETRKHQDLYMWLSKTPHGPSAKFLIQNVHTMDELKMTGNCLKGSRPLLSFDQSFDQQPHYQLLKEMFIHTFGTPKGHRKSKPFFDHVLSFSIADGRIWFRNYQIVEKKDETTQQLETSMVEVGPRFIMNLIRVFEGSFGGPVIFENPDFVSPNAIRSMRIQESGGKYRHRVQSQQERQEKLDNARPPRTELDEVDEVFKA